MANGPRFLVLDGYSKEGRADLQSGGATTAGELYACMLKACAPKGAEIDILCHPSTACLPYRFQYRASRPGPGLRDV